VNKEVKRRPTGAAKLGHFSCVTHGRSSLAEVKELIDTTLSGSIDPNSQCLHRGKYSGYRRVDVRIGSARDALKERP
jgi:hypothetical protein